MYNEFNTGKLEQLIAVAEHLKDKVGKDAGLYFADFISATKQLKEKVYPKMGVMVIPALGDSQKSELRLGIVPLPMVCIEQQDKPLPHLAV